MAQTDRPTGLIANKGVELLTFGTPNGFKVSILLEELKEAYGKDYTYQSIDLFQNAQKEPWFTALSPNSRIPVLIDHDQGGYAVIEGLAILNYLTRTYDPAHKFSFTGPLDICTAEQWLAWQHGGIGPTQAQANFYYRFSPQRHPQPTHRYVTETLKYYAVLNTRLAARDYIAGPGRGTYSIADIAVWPFVNACAAAGIELEGFENVYAWWGRVGERPAVRRGMRVPSGEEFAFGYEVVRRRRGEDERAWEEREAPLREALERGRREFGER